MRAEYEGYFLIGVLAVMIALAGYFIYQDRAEKKECAIFGEERTVRGLMPVGKIMVPTTYKTRDCLVWKE